MTDDKVHFKKDDILKRLKKIEGQIRGLQKMILEDRRCHDIFSQFSAINGAMRQVACCLMEQYIEQCLKNENLNEQDIRENLKYYLKTISR